MKRKIDSSNLVTSHDLFNNKQVNLDHPFFKDQLITYIGNKRSLLPFINEAIIEIKKELKKNSLFMMDGFAGSGSVSRLMLTHADKMVCNDLENYACIINKAYLSPYEPSLITQVSFWADYINKNAGNSALKDSIDFFISNNYAPQDNIKIKKDERVFYTSENARYIDYAKHIIHTLVPEELQPFLMANLLVKASIHTNTSGVFKGFHKKDGIGHFGGKGENALSRITKPIRIEAPALIEHNCEVIIENEDINTLIRRYSNKKFDIVYYDPPYNQHPYGSNYFMLNLISSKQKIAIQDGVSGIAVNWNRSAYNKRIQAENAMEDLIANTNSKYIIISYNNEGIIPFEVFKKILSKYGQVRLKKQDYNTYRGSRNLNNRNIKVEELLWILKKK